MILFYKIFKEVKMKLCVALDMESKKENLALARQIRENFGDKDIWLKVGLNAFIRDGSAFIRELQRLNFRIFLDLKLYDIPNTMLNALREIGKLNIEMLTIHASCGFLCMREIAKYLNSIDSNMKVIAVSVLTSFSEDEFFEIYNMSVDCAVRSFANLVYKAGLSGLVCSINEINLIKNVSKNLLAITPGIRLDSTESIESFEGKILNDQKRVATPSVAKTQGSDFIVVGRPIYAAKNKMEVINEILKVCE